MDESENSSDAKLTIYRLMIWTAGVAFSLTAVKLLSELRVEAYNRIWPNNPQIPALSTFEYLAAIVYGTCLTLFLVAIGTKNFWSSPGKIILMIFAFVCILDWGLSAFANTMITSYVSVHEVLATPGPNVALGTKSMISQSSASFVTTRGFVFGFYFQNLAGEIGYLVGIPVLLFVLYRSREKSKLWKFVWLGFLCFILLMVMEFYGLSSKLFSLPPRFAAYYFPCAIGIPIVSMVIAYCNDLIHKHKVDWWTTLACTLLPAIWVAMIAVNFFSR